MTTVKVTRRDINAGTPDDTDACPIARAIKRLVKKGVEVHVMGDDGVEFETEEKFFVRKLPVKAKNFIRAFDNDDAVEPFEFNLNIPAQLLRA